MFEFLKKDDPEVWQAAKDELEKQIKTINLIASENIAPISILQAVATVFTNKYAEGYPGKRYYGGCKFVDVVENLARERACKLFGAEHANVQPHSGSQANMAVYMTVMEPGETLLGMALAHGGHLTHGHPLNFSGKLYKVVSYTVDEKTGLINYDKLRELAKKHKPKVIVSGASAYPRIIDFKTIGEIAKEVGACHMADIAHIAGLVAAGVHPSPVPHAEFVTTTTHKTLRGPRGGLILTRKEFAEKIDKMIIPGIQGGPLVHVIAAKAVCFKLAMTEEFKEIQKRTVQNAKVLAERLMERGFKLVSGGTDNHLMLVDLRDRDITGKDAEKILESIGIIVNKNTIPGDPRPPLVTSGIRIGTPAVTSRGMGPEEMKQIADIIADALEKPEEENLKKLSKKVTDLALSFPIYQELAAEMGL